MVNILEDMHTVNKPGSLPKIVITRASGSNPFDPHAHSQYAGEKLQVRMVTLDEKYRSHLLHQQIKAFEEKVYTSYDNFNVDIMLKMFRELARRCKGSRDIYTIGGIRQAINQEIRKLRMRKRNKRLPVSEDIGNEHDDVMEYFNWFFKNLSYLRELRNNFVSRIFNPLFKYFYTVSHGGPDRERSTDSAMSMSNLSVASHRSFDSGITGISGWSSFRFSDTESQASGDDNIPSARKQMISKAALQLLGRELRDVRNLYDTTELEKTAQRLALVKEQLDYLIDNEEAINQALFSQDSERVVSHLKVKNSRTYTLMRLIPDILVKCQICAWLARKWLDIDDKKTKDLKERLGKLVSLEDQLSRRLKMLSVDIQKHERKLENETNELQKLLKREERTSELEMTLHGYENRERDLKDYIEKLEKEKLDLTTKLNHAIKEKKTGEYKTLQTMLDRNKLQLFAMERQMGTMSYHKNIVQNDMQVELEVKTNIIHFTNDVQDQCEELEKMLETEKKEKRTIQAALIPIAQDTEQIRERLRDKTYPVEDNEGIVAQYIGSSRIPLSTMSVMEMKRRFAADNPNPKHVPVFESPRKVNIFKTEIQPFPKTPDFDW
ncbi:uncharacterized protein LOC125665858 isoform X1 [Ostrea edulis]|uniref:uncharacterized protein LOC125665858 isoform X1 n=1 Tax=Ostrea edulis TaxID=37623 RepID=UPI0024AE9DC5|nr:uncharacterized protein LOC125665858 isoform X1 [Ostrea edulis]